MRPRTPAASIVVALLCTPAWLACAEQHASRDRPRPELELDAGTDATAVMPDESCESLGKRANERLWIASAPKTGRCQSHDDCVALAPRLSCSSECPRLAAFASDEPRITAEVSKLEAELCRPFAQADCTAQPARLCSSEDFVARCREQDCRLLLHGCDPGCSEQSDGLCHGASECEGCPSVLEDGDGLPCSQRGQSCKITKGCAAYLSCEEVGGELRWDLIIPLC